MKKGARILGRSVSVAALAVAGVGLLPAAVRAGGLCQGKVYAGTAYAPVAAAPVAYAPVAAAPVAYAPVAAAPVAYAPVATQALAPVAAAPTFTTGTTGYAVYTTGTASAPAAAGTPQAAAAPTRSGYYRQKWEWVETSGNGAAGSPKARRAAGAPRISTLKESDAARVRQAIADLLKANPSETVEALAAEGKLALITNANNQQTRKLSDLTPSEKEDILAIAKDEMSKAGRGDEVDNKDGTNQPETPDQPETAVVQQVLVPTMTTTAAPAAFAPVQLFVPTVHRCNIFCRH